MQHCSSSLHVNVALLGNALWTAVAMNSAIQLLVYAVGRQVATSRSSNYLLAAPPKLLFAVASCCFPYYASNIMPGSNDQQTIYAAMPANYVCSNRKTMERPANGIDGRTEMLICCNSRLTG